MLLGLGQSITSWSTYRPQVTCVWYGLLEMFATVRTDRWIWQSTLGNQVSTQVYFVARDPLEEYGHVCEEMVKSMFVKSDKLSSDPYFVEQRRVVRGRCGDRFNELAGAAASHREISRAPGSCGSSVFSQKRFWFV